MEKHYGYAGKLLFADLSKGRMENIPEDQSVMQKYLGGMALGAKILYEKVPKGIQWSDPENYIVLATGPLAGTRVRGSGTFCVVTKGVLTNGATSSQANGLFGAFLKFSGYDGVVITGKAEHLSYLYVHDGQAELKDARHLSGKGTWETEDLIKKELGLAPGEASVFSIGPAGENMVKFAALVGDRGHVAGHNGIGAIMGSKNLKALVTVRGQGRVNVYDDHALSTLAASMFERVKNDHLGKDIYKHGTLGLVEPYAQYGRLPIKNYTTNISPLTKDQLVTFSPEYLRSHCVSHRHSCWNCPMHDHDIILIADGKYAGIVGKEPEYEGF